MRGSVAGRPPRALVALVSLCLVALPLAGALGVTSVGSFRMFSEPVRYDLRVGVVSERGLRFLPAASLRPHLSRDAARVLLARGAGGSLGETHVGLALGGLGDLATLACRLAPDAQRVVVVLERHDVFAQSAPALRTEHAAECP